MIKGIVFDFDHTLYDRNATYANMLDDFISYFQKNLRPEISSDEVLKIIQKCDRTGVYRAGHWEAIYQDTLESGIFLTPPTYEDYCNGFIEKRFPAAMVAYDDTIPTLDTLRTAGYKVGVLTNGPSDYQWYKASLLHLQEHTDTILVGDDLPHPKPHISAFHRVCELLGCAPEDTLYVGDNPVNDIDGARNAGLIPVWFRSVGTWVNGVTPAPYQIDALGEIPALVRKINGKN